MAKQQDKKPYEAMFVVDSAQATIRLNEIEEHIRGIFDRHKVEMIGLAKWDDRPLAYPIRRSKRGTYILAFFNAAPDAISSIERDCQLSEELLRVLILRAEHLRLEDMKMQLGQDAGPRAARTVPVSQPTGLQDEASVENSSTENQ